MAIKTVDTENKEISDNAGARVRTILARALWHAENTGNIPKDPEERKAAFKKARPEFNPKVTRILKLLEENGFVISEKSR